MSDTALKTVWEYYDAARHAGKGGNYMFLLKAFGNAPYYSGETQDFEDRFTRNRTSHEKLFHDGMRTFMRKPFMDECTDRTHAGFASRWDYYKQQSAAEGERLVWVPTGSPNVAMGQEGAAFWASEVALLVSSSGQERHDVERRVQVDIMGYYDGLLRRELDWSIPPQSRLVGHGPKVVTEPTLEYQLDGGLASDANAFFSNLGT